MDIVKTEKFSKVVENEQISIVPISIVIMIFVIIFITILIWPDMIFFLIVPIIALGIRHLIGFP